MMKLKEKPKKIIQPKYTRGTRKKAACDGSEKMVPYLEKYRLILQKINN